MYVGELFCLKLTDLKFVCRIFSADVLNVHLVDVVSGSVVSTISHRRVRGPVNIVHSENWLVYTYYNDKVRRTELSKFVSPRRETQNART